MTSMMSKSAQPDEPHIQQPEPQRAEPPLPANLVEALRARHLPTEGEMELRRALEAVLPGYSLFRLTPAAVRKWKVRYRLMAGDGYYDGQSVCEVYARALLACSPAEA
jgi:hypothetical protein